MTISKKKFLSLALFVSASVASVNVLAADTHSGTISFSGLIYSSTCTVSINGGGSDGNVNMGRHPSSAFGTEPKQIVGGAGTDGQLNISLIDCPPTGTVALKISGSETPNEPQILALDNPSDEKTAKNVGVYIYDKDDLDTPYNINFTKNIEIKGSEESASTSTTIPLIAKYVSVNAGGVKAGQANATLNYSLTYK